MPNLTSVALPVPEIIAGLLAILAKSIAIAIAILG